MTAKIDWIEYIRSNVNLRIIYPPAIGLFEGLKDHFGRGVTKLMTYFEGDTCYWYYDQQDLYDTGEHIINKLRESEEFKDKFFAELDQKTATILKFVDRENIDFQSKSKEELANTYRKFAGLITDWYSASLLIDPTDEFLMVAITARIREILKAKLDNEYSESEFTRVYGTLTTPGTLTYLSEERRMLLALAGEEKLGKVSKESNEYQEFAQATLEKFWWTKLGWAKEEASDLQTINHEIDEILVKTDIPAEVAKMDNYEETVKSEKEKVEEQYQLSSDDDLSAWLEIFDKLVYVHDVRKEVQMKTNYFEYKLLDAIYRVTGLEQGLLDWCDHREIINFINTGELDQEKMRAGKDKFLLYKSDQEEQRLFGEQAKAEYKKILNADYSNVRDIQGTSACGGYVTGIAFVAENIADAMKIGEGQILVTGMTTPDFVPAMKKATAIVTDEGGITCHAAIVSRELGLPCIVGTRFATKVIKTGDQIEVRANHGTVIVK